MRGAELAVREKGRGPAFLWAHGLLASMAQEDEIGVFDWTSTAEAMRFVRYDARSHGDSEHTDDPDLLRWPALALDMLGVADALGEDPLVLGGASMGCGTALYAALSAPRRVDKLLLVTPPTAWTSRVAQRRLYRAGATMVASRGLPAFVAFNRSQPTPKRLAGAREVFLRHLAVADRRSVVAALRGASRSDLPRAERFARLDMPALILAWHDDPSHPVSTAEQLATALPDATLHEARTAADVRRWPDLVHAFVTGDPSDRPDHPDPNPQKRPR